MANSFDGRKWFLDTVVSASSITNNPIVVSKIRWVSASAIGHFARIADSNGQPTNGFWTSVSGSVANVEESNFFNVGITRSNRTLNGLRVMSLTSGFIELYVE